MYTKVMLTFLVAATMAIAVALVRQKSALDAASQSGDWGRANCALDDNFIAVHLESLPLQSAVETIARRAGVQIVVDWEALRSATSPVSAHQLSTVHFQSGSLRDVLKELF